MSYGHISSLRFQHLFSHISAGGQSIRLSRKSNFSASNLHDIWISDKRQMTVRLSYNEDKLSQRNSNSLKEWTNKPWISNLILSLFNWYQGTGLSGERRGRSYLPKLSHFSLFQDQGEVVLHRIYRMNIPKDYHFSTDKQVRATVIIHSWVLIISFKCTWWIL